MRRSVYPTGVSRIKHALATYSTKQYDMKETDTLFIVSVILNVLESSPEDQQREANQQQQVSVFINQLSGNLTVPTKLGSINVQYGGYLTVTTKLY